MATTTTQSPVSPSIIETTIEARLKAAYNRFVNAAKDTPEHDEAWKELTDALFANAK